MSLKDKDHKKAFIYKCAGYMVTRKSINWMQIDLYKIFGFKIQRTVEKVGRREAGKRQPQ